MPRAPKHPVRHTADPRRSETRDRLLEAAAVRFAEVGYHHAPLREIARLAGANVAAANYHFGGKEGLYLAVVERELARVPDPLPPEGFRGPPALRLRAFVRFMVDRLFGTRRPDRLLRMLSRELVEPSPALPVFVERVMRPNRRVLEEIVAALVRRPVGDPLVADCAGSVLAECVSRHHSRVVIRLTAPEAFSPAWVERLAEHIYRFSLGGIRAAASAARAGAPPRPTSSGKARP